MIPRIRILHCIETIASGGVEQTILTLVRGLAKEKFEHKIICTWKGGAVAEALEKKGVELISVGSFKKPFEVRKLKQVVEITREFKPDIIHGAVFEGMTMASVAGFFYRKAKVVLEETSDPQNRSRKANWLLRAYSWRAAAVQAISGEVGEYLAEVTQVDQQKIRVIPNGVQIPEILSKEIKLLLQKQYGIAQDDFVVGFVGRLFNNHKRFSDLLEALALIENVHIKLLIIGDGTDRYLLDSGIKRLNLFERVIYVGYQPKPSVFYKLMNVLCVPSAREGFGLVAAEAMMHGLPVIASRVGGLQNVVQAGETGFLIPPCTPEAIADKIQFLLNHPELRQEMGEKGRIRALEQYSAERYCREVENLYLDLLDRKKIEI